MNLDQLRDIQRRQKHTGDNGEDYVLALEMRRLQGYPLIGKVSIVGRYDIGLGYDIQSFESIQSKEVDRYIEVKTYSGTPHFFLSSGEWEAARKHGIHYYLYLVDESKYRNPGYEPIIVRNPTEYLLNQSDSWKSKIQQHEFTYVDKPVDNLPDGFDKSVVMVGCFNSNEHLRWILHSHCYNVRAQIGDRIINGAVKIDEQSFGVRYLMLYNVQTPRTYSVYKVLEVSTVTNLELRSMGYKNPHCPHYLLYRLEKHIDGFPATDILALLRVNNDKVVRTSGTPIYILGEELRRYFLSGSLRFGMKAPERTYTNSGKPWTANSLMVLRVMHGSGDDIVAIAHKLKREIEDVRDKMKELKLIQ